MLLVVHAYRWMYSQSSGTGRLVAGMLLAEHAYWLSTPGSAAAFFRLRIVLLALHVYMQQIYVHPA
ncbi:hypothetical protein BBD41_11505 [Paenibacillus ihbetae]|uniref:Uncharacterized protein n=1 Tax=Paenibacillus ihbetae TaxID=1870820 RepID=A0A1B2DZQ7_9BACL|nr:hypothetical protein BBD41_11505 [Paenibacillus ihbetae]